MSADEKPRVEIELEEKNGRYSDAVTTLAETLERDEAQELILAVARQTDRLERFGIYRPQEELSIHLCFDGGNGVGYELTELLDEYGWRVATTYQDEGRTRVDVVKK